MTKTETIEDILREMRDEMTGLRFVRGCEAIDSYHAAKEELSKFADRIEATLAKPQRNCDRAAIQTPWDAVMAWLAATDPKYAAIVRELEGDWEPARYEWEQIVGWMLAKAEEGGAK